ncbi:MAG: hypothetical protein F2519_04800 [Actinobacteria bacterium]|nr:hypothetical protein [Actinomycetota bacterium]MTA04881.1 hypothetical protein [Actinomycetota bacterium]
MSYKPSRHRWIRTLLLALIAPLFVVVLPIPQAHASINNFVSKFHSNTMTDFAMSSSGKYQLLAVDGDGVYLSSNFGSSWTQVMSGDPAVSYYAKVAVSGDGSKMAIGAEPTADANSYAVPGDLYTSADYGATWTNKSVSKAWLGIRMSDDGTKMLAWTEVTATLASMLFYSTNSGTSWTQVTQYSGLMNWNDGAVSADGKIWWAQCSSCATPGLFRSTNGSTWTAKSPPHVPAGLHDLSVSTSGTTIFATGASNIYRSYDTGTTWTQIQTPNSGAVLADNISTSGTGRVVMLSGLNNFIYLSNDSGTTWIESTFNSDLNGQNLVAGSLGLRVSRDGTLLMADVQYGELYEQTIAFPTAPRAVAVSPLSTTSFFVSWSVPTSAGDGAITDYVIETSTNLSTWNTYKHSASTSTNVTFAGLTQGASYYYRITPVSAWGNGDSVTSRAFIPGPAPRAPTSLVATAGNAQVILTWNSVVETSPIQTYYVESSIDAGVTYIAFGHNATTDTTIAVTGLSNGSSYLFRVRGVSDGGYGTPTVSSAAIPRTTPDAPTFVWGNTTTTVVSLAWQAPSFNGGSAITDYVIRYSSNAGGSWTTYIDSVTAADTATITGLTNGVNYLFRVAAKNIAGTGPESSDSSQIMLQDIGPATIVISLPGGVRVAYKSTSVIITATVSQDGRVTFIVGTKRIPGCASLLTQSLSITCKWKPAVQGSVAIRATLKPTNTYYTPVNSADLSIGVARRTGVRGA